MKLVFASEAKSRRAHSVCEPNEPRVSHLDVIPIGRSARQAGKDSHRGGMRERAPGSPTKRETGKLAFAGGARRVPGQRERQRRGSGGLETSSSDVLRGSVRLRHPVTADFILEVPPSVKNRMDLSGRGRLRGCSDSFFSLEVPYMPLHLGHVSLIGAGKHARHHPSV